MPKINEIEKDLTLELNKNKIKCDPLNYNFKANVFIKEENLTKFNVNNMDIRIIKEIIEAIMASNTYKVYLLNNLVDEPNLKCITELRYKYLDDDFDYKTHLLYCTNSIIKSNNYYINPNYLNTDTFPNYPEAIKKERFNSKIKYFYKDGIQNYIKMLVFDSMDNNLLKDILYIPYQSVNNLNLEELRNLAYLYTEESTYLKIDLLRQNGSNVLNISPKYSLIRVEGIDPINNPIVTMVKESIDDFDFIYLMFTMSIIYSIELFHTIKHSKYTEEVKENLINYFLDKDNVIFDSKYYKTFSKYVYDYDKKEWVDFVKDIFNVDTLQERYNIYKSIFITILKELQQSTVKADYMDGLDVFPNTLCTLINYYQDTAYKEVLKKSVIKLLDFCKNKGISLAKIHTKSKNVSYSDMEIDFMQEYLNEENEETGEPNKLFNNTLGSLKKDDEVFTSKSSNIKQINLEKDNDLDKVISNFKDAGYTYDVSLINKPISENAENTYSKLVNSIELLTKDLTRQIKNIKTYNSGGKLSGLKSGRLDTKRLYLYKQTDMLFYNNKYKLKEMDLAFGIILDESGSMSGEGIENGKITMILLHEVLKSLNINHCIIGHNSSSYHQCNIHKYQPFKEDKNYTLLKCKNLINIEDRGCNCDSGALYYMQKELNRVKNKDKICIIFSDGEPTRCSDSELKDQVKRMEKRGIRVIGIGINFENIKAYYPHHANGRNLKEMLDIVTDILKEYVLERVN